MVNEKSCGAVVFRAELQHDGNEQLYVLMIKQSQSGRFSFPKGHVEAGESETETAEREVFEETAVKIEITDDFRRPVYYKPRPGVKKEVVYFAAYTHQTKTHKREGEIAEVDWIPTDKAAGLLAHSNDRRVFAAALEYMQGKYFNRN